MSVDPLDPELRALFDAEAEYSDMPASAPGHILAKVGAALIAAPIVTQAAAQATWRATVIQHVKRTATWVAFGTGAASGVAGYATIEHATVHRGPSTQAPAATVVQAAAPPSLPASEPEPTATVSVPVLSVPVAPSVPSAAPPEPPPPARPGRLDDAKEWDGIPSATRKEDSDLAIERADLEEARTALARGQAAAALGVLQADAIARPHGRLSEERDSMTIQALALAGRTDEARARATTFARRYPRSLFLPVVQAAIGGPR